MKKFVQLISIALLAVMCVALLASCAPASDPDKAEKALKDAGYVVNSKAISTAVRVFLKDVQSVVAASKTDDDKNVQTVIIIYFNDADAAKSAYEDSTLKKYFDDKKENKEETEYVYARSGKMIYWGTKTAIKDAR